MGRAAISYRVACQRIGEAQEHSSPMRDFSRTGTWMLRMRISLHLGPTCLAIWSHRHTADSKHVMCPAGPSQMSRVEGVRVQLALVRRDPLEAAGGLHQVRSSAQAEFFTAHSQYQRLGR